jgi:hypothetical protein
VEFFIFYFNGKEERKLGNGVFEINTCIKTHEEAVSNMSLFEPKVVLLF